MNQEYNHSLKIWNILFNHTWNVNIQISDVHMYVHAGMVTFSNLIDKNSRVIIQELYFDLLLQKDVQRNASILLFHYLFFISALKG